MQRILIGILATFSYASLIIYDFLCICLLIGKEELVEKIWRKVLPNKPYNEVRFFIGIRPLFLSFSFIMFILSKGNLSNIPGFDIFLYSAPVLALLVIIKINFFY